MEALETVDRDDVLAEATLNAGAALGLSRAELARVLRRDRSRLRESIRVGSDTGEFALLVVRVYRSLYALVDGNADNMVHWMKTPNRGTGGIPREQMQSLMGLAAVVNYLDAIRGKL